MSPSWISTWYSMIFITNKLHFVERFISDIYDPQETMEYMEIKNEDERWWKLSYKSVTRKAQKTFPQKDDNYELCSRFLKLAYCTEGWIWKLIQPTRSSWDMAGKSLFSVVFENRKNFSSMQKRQKS